MSTGQELRKSEKRQRRQPMMLQIMDQESMQAKEDKRAKAVIEILSCGPWMDST